LTSAPWDISRLITSNKPILHATWNLKINKEYNYSIIITISQLSQHTVEVVHLTRESAVSTVQPCKILQYGDVFGSLSRSSEGQGHGILCY